MRRQSVGFLIFAFAALLCASASAQGTNTSPLYEISDALQSAKWAFSQMELSSAKRTITGDTALTEKRRKYEADFREAEKKVATVAPDLMKDVNQKVRQWVECDDAVGKLLQSRRELQKKWANTTEQLVLSFYDWRTRARNSMFEGVIEKDGARFLPERDVQQLLTGMEMLSQAESQRRIMLSILSETDSKRQSVLAKQLASQFEHTAKWLEEFQSMVSEAETADLEKIRKNYMEYTQVCQEMSNMQLKKTETEAKKDRLAAETWELFGVALEKTRLEILQQNRR